MNDIPQKSFEKGRYTPAEEAANVITHGIGAMLSIAALVVLAVLSRENGSSLQTLGLLIYGLSLFMLYAASSAYHAVTGKKLKRFFRHLDHCSIFLLIAGTYTPVLLIAMSGPWAWALLAMIWGMAVAGLIFEIVYLGRYKWVSLAIYASMGWLAIIAIKPMIEMLPHGLLFWVFLGGLLYTSGILFYVCKRLPFNHAIWHVFVLAGSSLHFIGILRYLTPGLQ
jgi:hemolysin III